MVVAGVLLTIAVTGMLVSAREGLAQALSVPSLSTSGR
jgi:hypothetical protein